MGASRPKQFLSLAGEPILAHTLRALSAVSFLDTLLLVVPRDHEDGARRLLSDFLASAPERPFEVRIVHGGAERQDSVNNGLMHLPADCEWVLIHDGVRPFASAGLITAAWEGARETGASIVAVQATDTVKSARDGRVSGTLRRDEIWLVQTPQVFRKDIILSAYRAAVDAGWKGTDDSSFVERIGVSVAVVRGERSNIKVTTPDDLVWAEWFLSEKMKTGGPDARRVRV